MVFLLSAPYPEVVLGLCLLPHDKTAFGQIQVS